MKKFKAYLYEAKHIGLNLAILSKQVKEFYQTNEAEETFVEIISTTAGVKAYGRVWYEEIEQLQDNQQEGISIGLEKTLMDACSLRESDIVEIRQLKQHEIKEARVLDLEPIGNSYAKIQTEKDLQYVKNRISGGEVVLTEGSHFIVPFLEAGITHQLLFRVRKTEPQDYPVRCNERTTIVFKGLLIKAKDSSVGFSYVGGLKKQISLLREMVQLPMEHPDVFLKMGITPPRGVLLYGPPGNGKTLLARALANEFNAQFYTINGPEIISKFVGEGERKLREVFEKARVNAPSVIFFDEIDSIAGKRDSFTSEIEIRLVGQLLSLMDGLDDRGNVIVIAATNRHNALDPALRRPGRFDREIEIGLPTELDRFEILKVHVRDMELASDVDLQYWAKKTSGYTGADLAALTREAAICCLRRVFALSPDGHYIQAGNVLVSTDDFLTAFKELQPTNLRDVPIQEKPVLWNQIIGLKDIKEQLINLVKPSLETPYQLKTMDLTVPSGILLVGSPRSGKKSLILALANELSIQCIVVRALSFMNQHPRQQGQSLAEIFRKARVTSPSIILIDGIDLLFSNQLRGYIESFLLIEDLAHEIRRNRLYDNTFVMGTARTIDCLPPTLLDTSVFGHVLHIPKPSLEECESIIRARLAAYLSNSEDYRELAKLVEGLNSGEVIAVCEDYLRKSLNTTADFQNGTFIKFKQSVQLS